MARSIFFVQVAKGIFILCKKDKECLRILESDFL